MGNGRNDEARLFREVLGAYPTGVCVVATKKNGQDLAMVVGSFTSISLEPPLVGFFPAKASRSWHAMHDCARFCVSVLGAEQAPLCQALVSTDVELPSVALEQRSPSGQPVISGAIAWIDCKTDRLLEIGDHWLIVGQVEALARVGSGGPLVFHGGRYRTLCE